MSLNIQWTYQTKQGRGRPAGQVVGGLFYFKNAVSQLSLSTILR